MTDETSQPYPRKSLGAFMTGLTILSRHMTKGLSQTYAMFGEHDIIHIGEVDFDMVPENSLEGLTLMALGFHAADEGWAFYT